MGQEQKTISKTAVSLKHTTDYDSDPRLAEYKRALPSYFSAMAEKVIQDITNLINQIPQDPIEQYLTYAIDIRFNHWNSSQAKDSSQNLYGQNREWHQLSSQQRFLNLLNAFAKQYSIEQVIEAEYQILISNAINQHDAFQTLRSPLPFKFITLSQQLIVRMLLRYYLKLIKLYANSGEKHLMRFHEQTGRQLCLMIIKGHLQLVELYSLFYQLVYIDKHPTKITNKLAQINKKYHWKCLRTQYSINAKEKQLQKMRTVARLYLDQLYLSSLREAQDPQIKLSDDSLLPVKIFPISRVKDKPRS